MGLLLRTAVSGIPGSFDLIGNFEWRKIPAKLFSAGFDLFHPQWGTVCIGGSLFIGCAEADDSFSTNQRRALFVRQSLIKCFGDGAAVVPVNVCNDPPAIGFKSFGRVVGEPGTDFTID